MSVRMWHYNPFLPLVPPHKPMSTVFGVGLALGLWLYAGYEQLSTVAEEVENPQKNYPRALAWVVPISIATYFVPTACALAALGNWQDWHTGYFSHAARLIGGPSLGFAMTIAAGITNIALLNSTVLTATRVPFAMAEDGYLSKALTHTHPKFGTPWLTLAISSLVYSLLAWNSLTQLIAVYMWLRIATSVLTVLSAWRLRRTQPDLERAFRIPWGRAGMGYAVLAPLSMSVVAVIGAVWTSDRFAMILGPLVVILGPIAYLFCRRRKAAPI